MAAMRNILEASGVMAIVNYTLDLSSWNSLRMCIIKT